MNFDIHALLAEASTRSGGLEDFGDDSFRPALAVLLHALDEEGGLSEAGRERLHGRIVERLQNRLGLEDFYQRHPEIDDEEVTDPIVIPLRRVMPPAGRVDTASIAALDWPFRIHLVLGMTIFLLFPFSRLVHVWSGFGTAAYLIRPYQIVRARRLNVPAGHNQPRRPGASV